jgi:hypothetical protein
MTALHLAGIILFALIMALGWMIGTGEPKRRGWL